MADFTLIDLESQSEAVQKYVSEWDPEAIKNWMKRFGTVEEIKGAFGPLYSFQSPTSKKVVFFFDEENNLIVIKTGWRMC